MDSAGKFYLAKGGFNLPVIRPIPGCSEMIRLILILFIALDSQSHAGLAWESKSIKLKAEPGQSSATVEFVFRNGGAGVVEIEKVSTSCGCTTATIDKKIIAPGEKGSIKGKFDFGPREGIHTKLFRVLTSDGKHETLHFTVDIPTLYQFPAKLFVWTVSDGKAKPGVCRLLNQSSKSIEIQSVKSSNPVFGATLKEVRPGFEYELTITPTEASRSSRSIITITAEPTPGNKPKVYKIYTVIR